MEKLIRDNIPEIAQSKGEILLTRLVQDNNEYIKFLLCKIDEELLEFNSASHETKVEEAGDVLEVYDSLIEIYNNVDTSKIEGLKDIRGEFINTCITKFGMDIQDILEKQVHKRGMKGGFKRGIIGIF